MQLVQQQSMFGRSHYRLQINLSDSFLKQIKNFSMDIVLDTPVLVLPRSSRSSQVFVVHLGKISITNNQLTDPFENDEKRSFKSQKSTDCDMKIFTIDEEMLIESSMITARVPSHSPGNYLSEENLHTKSNDTDVDERQMETYILDIRNINAYSLDTRNRKSFRLSALPRAEEFYSCHEDAEPVLHDTAIRVNILRYSNEGLNTIDLLSDSIEAKELLQVIISCGHNFEDFEDIDLQLFVL